MKNSLLVSLLLIYVLPVKGQITIDSSDFANAGETVVYSQASPLTPGIDLTQTGAAFTWDFSQLSPTSQTADTFITISSFGNVYSLFFINNSFNPYRSNMSARGTFPQIPGVSLTDIYNFYYKSNNDYRQTGVGATLNGAAVPVPYTDPDVIYAFPLDFNDSDSSVSNFGVSIPNLGSYTGTQTRVSITDGWGTVITPYGSFNCLRQVSTLTGHDSVYVDSLMFGAGFDRPLTREYKWIAEDQDGPVLQIVTQELLPGTEAISSIIYRDSVLVTSVTGLNHQTIRLSPNPVNDVLTLTQNTLPDPESVLKIFDSQGRQVYSGNAEKQKMEINCRDWPAGFYSVEISSNRALVTHKIFVIH
jgi:hypothetical protein